MAYLVLLGLGTGIGIAAMLSGRRRRRRRRRRREAPEAPPVAGKLPRNLTGMDNYVVWAGKTWTRAEAHAGVHALIDPLDRAGMEEFFREFLDADIRLISDFMAVARWGGVTGDDVNVLMLEGLFPVLSMEEIDRVVNEEEAYWNREADEGRF